MHIEQPNGAITSIGGFKNAVERSKTEGNILVYLVEQMGNLSVLKLNENTIIETERDYPFFSCEQVNKEYSCERCFGDLNIGSHHNEHYAFFDKHLAEEYSESLKNNPEYVQSVYDHWARCDGMDFFIT